MSQAKDKGDRNYPMIRGVVCRSTFAWAIERFGEEKITSLQVLMPADISRLGIDVTRKGAGFLDSVWYPAAQVSRMLPMVMRDHTHAEQLVLAQDAGVYVMEKQIRGLQRALLSLMMSPKRYIKHAPRAWRHNFSDGDLHYESGDEAGRAWHRCIYKNWGVHDPLICRMMMHGKVVLYKTMGCEDVELTVESCDQDGAGCSSLVTWKS